MCDTHDLAEKISSRAVSLGFERCGIVHVGAMRGYAECLENRGRLFPESDGMLRMFSGYADPSVKYPWAKSVVICSWRYGVYRVPQNFAGRVGKAYLFDGRRDAAADAYKAKTALEKYITGELGLRAATSENRPVTAYRWAAQAAGIGMVRRNNFFYGDHGSYYTLAAFLTDAELEYIHPSASTPCPDNCDLCVKNCPTRSLESPYAMCATTCASFLLTMAKDEAIFERHSADLGGWIYGCDVCQDVCPHNRGEWLGEKEFPGLAELGEHMSPESVLSMDYGYLRNAVVPKFWYIAPQDAWMWKRNALNAIRNNWDARYEDFVKSAAADEDERVRAFAKKIAPSLGIGL
jgi:epoxyqueuosine reductase